MAGNGEDKKESEDSTDEAQSRMIRDKCHACAKGNFCMIDRTQRLLCAGPKK